MKRSLLLLLLLVSLSACSGVYTAVDRDERVSVGGAYTVAVGGARADAWAEYYDEEFLGWTVNGPELDSLVMYGGLKDGQALVDSRNVEDEPTFAADMRENEVLELLVATLSVNGAAQIEARGLRPADFGGKPGFRFELSFFNSRGLEKRGLAVGALDEGRLHLIVYTGADLHYFDEHADEVEAIIGSVRFIVPES